MELIQVRRVILTAIAADDFLSERLVLKGGNALELIHRIGSRASIDLDFSTAEDFEDPEEVGVRLKRSLEDRFDAAGYIVFDFSFGPRPTDREHGARWGGYNGVFKIIRLDLATSLGEDLDDMRRQAEAVGPSDSRKFRIEISVFEHVKGRVEADVDSFTCYVYTLEMIAAEKLRAICQQAPSYALRIHPTSRARDFYDIFTAISEGGVSFSDDQVQELVVEMFRVKEVPLELLAQIDQQRELHREEWTAVENAVDRRLRDFDFYFDFVLEEIRALDALWMEYPPS